MRPLQAQLSSNLTNHTASISVNHSADHAAVNRLGFGVRPNTWDRGIIDEVVTHDTYRIGRYTGPRASILDVGAHVGAFCSSMKRVFPTSMVVALEAAYFNLEPLQHNMALAQGAAYGQPILGFFNAIGGQDNLPVMVPYPGANTGGGGTVTPEGELTDQVTHTVTLPTICRELGLDRFDVVKMDCEGGEHALLTDEESRVFLARSVYVTAEIHQGRGNIADAVEWFRGNFHKVEFVRSSSPNLATVHAWQAH